LRRVACAGVSACLSECLCAFVCVLSFGGLSAFVCSFRGLFACVLSWVEIL